MSLVTLWIVPFSAYSSTPRFYYFILYTQEESIGFAKTLDFGFSMDLHVSMDLHGFTCPEHDLNIFKKCLLSVGLYYFVDTVSQEQISGN